MSARCGFCSAALADAPPGTAVRCASCGNVTTTPALPPTRPVPIASSTPFASISEPSSLPFSRVDGPKQGASPPPSVVLPSRAGGVDELIGGGITILGIGLAKFLLLSLLFVAGSCVLGMLGMLLR